MPTPCVAPICAVVLTLVAAPLARAEVWTVSAWDPLADFQEVQPAIDAAAEGDTILVTLFSATTGESYAPFVIDGKSLTILFDTLDFATTSQRGSIVRNLSADQEVRLGACRFLAEDALTDCIASVPTLSLTDNEGLVWIAGCRMETYAGSVIDCTSLLGGDNLLEIHAPELAISNCANVYFSDLFIQRTGSATATQPECMRIENSRVIIQSATVNAGACLTMGGQGAVAASVTDSEVGIWNSFLRGGNGGASNVSGSIPGGAGGEALVVSGVEASVLAEQSIGGGLPLLGGAGGLGGVPGPQGEPFANVAGASAPDFLDVFTGRLSTPITNQAGSPSWLTPESFDAVTFTGLTPGSLVFLFVGLGANSAPLPLFGDLQEPICIDPAGHFILNVPPANDEGWTEYRLEDQLVGLIDPSSFVIQGVVLDPLSIETHLTNAVFATILQAP